MNYREVKILDLISKGYTTQEISSRLYLSSNTVKTYRTRLMEKLQARNAANLVYRAVRSGYLTVILIVFLGGTHLFSQEVNLNPSNNTGRIVVKGLESASDGHAVLSLNRGDGEANSEISFLINNDGIFSDQSWKMGIVKSGSNQHGDFSLFYRNYRQFPLPSFEITKPILSVAGDYSSNLGNIGIGTAPTSNAKLYLYDDGTAENSTGLHVVLKPSAIPFSYSTAIHGFANGDSSKDIIGVLGSASQNESGGRSIGVQGYGEDFNFFAAGPGIDYGQESSQRWKSNVREISNAIEKVNNIRGVYFEWDQEHGGGQDVGFIAEEVGRVLPEIVEYEENGIDALGMDYSKITPLLLQSIKELNAKYEQLLAIIKARGI